MPKTLRKLDSCPNCGQPLAGVNNFCPDCGQQNTTKNVSVGFLVRDFLDDYFTLDSRLVRSILPLVTKPGFLTLEFNQGRRMKFTPPLRMYLIFSLLFFIVPSPDDDAKDPGKAAEEVHAAAGAAHGQPDSLAHDDNTFRISGDSGRRSMDVNIENLDHARLTDKDYQDSLVNAALDSLEVKEGTAMRKYLTKLGKTGLNIAADGGKAFAGNLKENIPNMMFFLLPVFALLIQLFHLRKKPLYVDSLIFSLHYHSFFFLIFAVSNAISWGIGESRFLDMLFALAAGVYLVLALRRVFRQGYGVTVLKLFGLFMTYGVVLVVSFVATFLITLVTYQ